MMYTKKRFFIILISLMFLVNCGGGDENVQFQFRDPIVMEVIQALPDSIAVGVSYPISYRFRNISPSTVTGLSFTPIFPPQFVENTPNATSCRNLNSLAGNQSCIISGTFKADAAGNYNLGATFNFTGGNFEFLAKTDAIGVNVITTIINTLPANVAVNSPYPITLRFTNNGQLPAEGITFTPPTISGFVPNAAGSNCPTTNSLDVGQSCTYAGTFTAPATGAYNLIFSLNYNGGQKTEYTASTTASEVPIQGRVTSILPIHTRIGGTYPVSIQFTNPSFLAATNVVYSKNYPTGFTETSNNCSNIIAANSSCTISGNFSPVSDDKITESLGVTLSYQEGSDVTMSTMTEVTPFNMFNITLTSANLTSTTQDNQAIFFNFDQLTKKIITPANGDPQQNYFLVLGDLQTDIEASSFLTTDVFRAPLVNSSILWRRGVNNSIQLNFRAYRPGCVALNLAGTQYVPARRQLNDRTACSVAPGSQRQIEVTIDPNSFSRLSNGIHTYELNLSNRYYRPDLTGQGQFSNMAVLRITVQK